MSRVDGNGVRWVVVQSGAWLGYEIPLALEEAGELEALATDWYSALDRPLHRAALRLLPAGATATLGRRYRAGVPSTRVRSWPLDAVRARVERSFETSDVRLGERGGRLAASRNAGVFSFSYYAHAAFRAADASLPRVIHQVHPHPASLRTLFGDEMQRVPGAAESLSREHEMTASGHRLAQLDEEPRLADRCIVASEYTKRTVVENGVDERRVDVIPYGVDLDFFQPANEAPTDTFRVLFVGQMIQRKGLSYLLDAWNALGFAGAELVLAGRGGFDSTLYARAGSTIRVEQNVSRGRLRELFQLADVFCMPSLAEGFGLVYLEALACGTPVIGTTNTAVADLVTDGKQGFTIPIRDTGALVDRLAWCYENRDGLAAMRRNARALAEQFPWSRFRHGVAAVAHAVGAQWHGGAR